MIDENDAEIKKRLKTGKQPPNTRGMNGQINNIDWKKLNQIRINWINQYSLCYNFKNICW